ncbi:MAG: chemotaxis protein CheB [Spongiibacteraceae bacterium]|nr:chemotaxis protein CheB [Spongiibacteraceae bacterium]
MWPCPRLSIKNGTIYFALPGYHLLVEEDRVFSLSVDPKVNYSRPSVDTLFESAADVYESELVGVILTGANSDGALSLKKIKMKGGHTIVQDPTTANAPEMPHAAIDLVKVDQVLPLTDIGQCLAQLNTVEDHHLTADRRRVSDCKI